MSMFIALSVIASVVAAAEGSWPLTTTTSTYCRLKCVDTWLNNHDTWLKYVECDVKVPGSEKLYCIEMPQPWVWGVIAALPFVLICACCYCLCGCCAGRDEERRNIAQVVHVNFP